MFFLHRSIGDRDAPRAGFAYFFHSSRLFDDLLDALKRAVAVCHYRDGYRYERNRAEMAGARLADHVIVCHVLGVVKFLFQFFESFDDLAARHLIIVVVEYGDKIVSADMSEKGILT